jgi:hypothetical protein
LTSWVSWRTWTHTRVSSVSEDQAGTVFMGFLGGEAVWR